MVRLRSRFQMLAFFSESPILSEVMVRVGSGRLGTGTGIPTGMPGATKLGVECEDNGFSKAVVFRLSLPFAGILVATLLLRTSAGGLAAMWLVVGLDLDFVGVLTVAFVF